MQVIVLCLHGSSLYTICDANHSHTYADAPSKIMELLTKQRALGDFMPGRWILSASLRCKRSTSRRVNSTLHSHAWQVS